ncbi:MAG TPA: ATP-binding protein [Candidatus Sulfotelmatobacter sp.]|nr:ATP-binding protein [Candidatus Sulfotelmatobacter sp.]
MLEAFRCFVDSAYSLEISYRALQEEVERLRGEVAQSNSELARRSEENSTMRVYLDRILERLPCGVLVLSSEGEISKANTEALRLLRDNSLFEASSSEMKQIPEPIETLLNCSRQENEAEIAVTGSDGSVRWLAARHATSEESRSSGSIFILSDVTERKKLAEKEREHQRDQALAEMTAVLAHEIRNPLGSLELFTGLLAESRTDENCRVWIEHLQAGLRTLSATVNNVLHFHSEPAPQFLPVDLGSLLEWAQEFLDPLARQSRIILSLQSQLSGYQFAGDRHPLEQVLLNLVLNSVRAMPAGGWIELAGRRLANGGAAIVVSDTGPGISEEDLPRLFEPGFSRRAGSPGLGLAVCRKIVEQHGGRIEAANRAQGGAIFTVTLPRYLSAEQEVAR